MQALSSSFKLKWRDSVEFDANALSRIAAEEAPQNDHQRDDGDAGYDVESVSA